MSKALDLARVFVPRNNTAAMQLILLYAQSGHTAWTAGEVEWRHVQKLMLKLDERFNIGRVAHQRVYFKARGQASAHVVVLPDDTGLVRWVMMSTRGKYGLLDRAVPWPGVVKDIRARGQNLEWKHYDLFRMGKRYSEDGNEVTDETWSFRIRANAVRAHEAYLVEHARLHDRRSVEMHLEALRSMPLFGGVRSQVMRLHVEAAKVWRKFNADALPRVELADLPVMTKIKIYEEPRRSLLDLSRDYTNRQTLISLDPNHTQRGQHDGTKTRTVALSDRRLGTILGDSRRTDAA